MRKFGFGELELAILRIVNDHGRATVRDVWRALGDRGGYTTIMTVMSRLAEKGELIREKEGKQYLYWIAPTHKTPSKNILQRIQDKIFGGKPTALVRYLLESDNEISDEELAEIEQLIQRRKLEKKHG